jgi:flagellar biosynthetic protein FlhB
MADEGGEKTEEASEKKIQDARKQGNVPKSKDLTGVFVFLVGLSVVKATWPNFEGTIKELFHFTIDHMTNPVDLERATMNAMLMALVDILLLSIPIAFGAAIIGGLVEFVQVGSNFTIDPLMPKLDKLNPMSGFKNMFAKKKLMEMVASMGKIGITGYVVYGVVRDAMGMVVATIRGDIRTTMMVMGELVYRVSVRVGMLLFAFAIVDVFMQRRSYFKGLMMTKEDQKKEYKESEGDPHTKQKRKEVAMEMLEGAQMESAKGADVIVTNPDHVAIAIKYDKERDGAPRVIAKGIEARAEALRAIARAADVPLLRNVPLAHALLRIDVNEEVPEELYDAVAEVLNFVYQLRNPAPVPEPMQGRGSL